MTLSRKEAAALLYISDSTLLRRTKAGQYTATRTGEGQFGKLSYTYEGLGLVEPTPEPEPAPVVAQPTVERILHEPEPTFAPREAPLPTTDSFGNVIGSGDPKLCLLGPVVRRPQAPMSSTSHMHPDLVGSTGEGGSKSYLNSLEYQRDHGYISHATYDDLQANVLKARRKCEQSNKEWLDRAAIENAFRHGFSR